MSGPCDEHVDVRVEQTPTAFVWRGRLHVVHQVLGQWREHPTRRSDRGAGLGGGVALAEPTVESEIWRIEASAGRTSPRCVYDLRREVAPGGQGVAPSRWSLLEICD